MSDPGSVFRTKQEPSTPTVSEMPIAEVKSPVVTHAPELMATYEADMGKPYVAKYYGLEEVASEPEFTQDLKTIEAFVRSRVEKGELDNSTKAADKYLKDMEKKAGLTGYESANKKITTLLAYIEFKKVVES